MLREGEFVDWVIMRLLFIGPSGRAQLSVRLAKDGSIKAP